MNFINGKIIKKDGDFYFAQGNFKVKILEQMHKKLQKYTGEKIILGIRPENIYDKLFASNATPNNTLSVVCDVVETMGASNYLYLSSGDHTMTAVVDAANSPIIGSRMDIVFNMKKVHFFDPSTEHTIV